MSVLCPHFEDHTPSPEGYIAWHYWAEKMSKTHRQRKCPGCGLFVIWEPFTAATHASARVGTKPIATVASVGRDLEP